MKHLIILLIKGYKLALSPFLGRCCRFHPSCATYAMEAVDRHGAFKGSWLTIKRIGRCHPWHEGGEDPVPPRSPRRPSRLLDRLPARSSARPSIRSSAQ